MEVVLGVGLDAAVAGGIADAEQSKTLTDLIVVEEALIGLVNGTTQQLASAGGAGTSTAGVRQIYASFFSGIEDVDVVGALERRTAFNADLVGGPSVRKELSAC